MSYMKPRRLSHLAGVVVLLLLAGCVTINIYFPAAAAEKAADKIIDEVWQLQDGRRAPRPSEAQPAGQGSNAEGAKP